jgi:pyruvate-formate lyase-activating enzyme/ABC-type Fe3+-hydroxamate transport system substrate-binding protein
MYTVKDNVLVEKYPDSYLVVVPSEIESMPMLHYYPGGKFLQVCTIGCNFRCSGCVSWVLTENPETIKHAVHILSPEALVDKAQKEGCHGIMFSFNEPAVSFFTFKQIALLARENGLLVGCATNGYFTDEAFRELVQLIDFINIGIKGCTAETYSMFGAISVEPIFRNLRTSIESGVFTEVAAVYIKGSEDEVLETAKKIAAISRDIPFQVMRFIPLGTAEPLDEPSVREAEALCGQLKKLLNYVYLFNSPGTDLLNTYCPECGSVIVRRGFNGPMCAHTVECREGISCQCGFKPPFKGEHIKDSGAQVLGFFGGYKTILSLESVQTVLAFLGERDPGVIAKVLQHILKTGFIKGLYERTKQIGSYLDTVDHYAGLAGRKEKSKELRAFIEGYLSIIVERLKEENPPRTSVYFALGHPLIAVFGDKFDCNLVETAGGRCVNRDLERDDTPGMTISYDAFKRLNPDLIFINGAIGYPVDDFYNFCMNNDLDIRAVKDKKIYNLHPYNTGGRPDWILGLMQMSNLIHPEIFNFDMKFLADEFYERFLGIKFHSIKRSRSITHPAVLNTL